MTDAKLPPAVTGTEMRLDALIARVDRLCDLLTPAEPVELKVEFDTIELREPEQAEQPPKRRRR